jgi:hypothetical protein
MKLSLPSVVTLTRQLLSIFRKSCSFISGHGSIPLQFHNADPFRIQFMTSKRSALSVLLSLLILLPAGSAFAWGAKGHAATGILAMKLTDEKARGQLNDLFGSTSNERMDELCNWPDAMRELPHWNWSSPQHYINIPRSSSNYAAERDCADGLCATEAVKKYAAQLADDRLSTEKRVQAFGWLCHVVGDIHQPLHCGYADDQGGNLVDITVNGEEMNLHSFWDSHLIDTRAGTLNVLLEQLSNQLEDNESNQWESNQWNPHEVDQWTNVSRQLAATKSYPVSAEISDVFSDESWQVIQHRLPIGAMRLARILNATLGEGEVLLDRAKSE